jgi:hypothetical protein
VPYDGADSRRLPTGFMPEQAVQVKHPGKGFEHVMEAL